jgi:hypothetical protein
MEATLNLILDTLFLDVQDTFRPNRLDHIKVSPAFMNYLKAYEQDKILYERADDQPSGMIVRYKAIPIVVDTTLTDHYKVVYTDNFGPGTFVEAKDLSHYKCVEDYSPFVIKTSERILRNKENNNV